MPFMRPVQIVQELGGADVHTSKSGVADHFAENEPEAGALGDRRVRSCSVSEVILIRSYK